MSASVPTSTLEVESSQDENGRVHQEGPGDGETLTLTAGEGDSALADPGVVAVGECVDEVVQLRDPGGPHHLVQRCA